MKGIINFLIMINCIIWGANGCMDVTGTTLLIPKHRYIPIYHSSKGDSVENYIINDTIQEDFPILSIKSFRDGRVKILGHYPMGSYPDVEGWMETEYMGIFLNIYSGETHIQKSPHPESVCIYTIQDAYWGHYYPVVDARNNWLKIIYDEINSGWISPECQCSNPYTPCN